MQTRLFHLYKEFKRLFDASDRKRDSQSQFHRNSDNNDELQLPDYSISGMPDNTPADDEQRRPAGSPAVTEKLGEVNSLMQELNIFKRLQSYKWIREYIDSKKGKQKEKEDK